MPYVLPHDESDFIVRARLQRGFTLIELMIAISLGMLLVYTATAGFRSASQSVTLSNRLALENSLLRAGYFAAVQSPTRLPE